jgi:hypothetical protein
MIPVVVVILIVLCISVFFLRGNMTGGSFSYIDEDISDGNDVSLSKLPNVGRVYLPMPLYPTIANLPPLSVVYGHPLPLMVPMPGPLSQPMYIEHNAGYTCSKSCCPSDNTCVGGCICKPYVWVD